jgi:light-regulated signal transduction histidine kinase (bacteriophytochrome)
VPPGKGATGEAPRQATPTVGVDAADEFANLVSHDLQQPLRHIRGFSDLLLQRYAQDLPDEAREFVDYIVQGAANAQSLLDALLRYARVSTRGKPFEAVDCARLLSRCGDALSSRLHEAGAAVEVGALPCVFGDEFQLLGVFQELLVNAIKFRHGGRPLVVRVDAEPCGDRWRFRVQDNGIGVATENLERIFRVCQRLHRQEEYPGNGMGLAICRRVIMRHGGAICAESVEEGGCRVVFDLPACETGPAQADSAAKREA